jgi:Pyruvate/2-oxoacid:ferredoxin oxidoreductase delta subunit
MARPVWFVNLIKKAFPGRFRVARLTNLPVVGCVIDRSLFEGDDIIYLPKDDVAERMARHVVQVGQPIEVAGDVALPSQVVTHFIEQANYHWIMDFCICRESEGCEDYPIDLGCLFLGEAVLGINPQLGRRVTKVEALEHVQRCREAGLIHLIGRNKLDSVWLGVKPGHKLLTICNCCPCCCLWRAVPQLNPSISGKITKMPGVSVTVTERCEGCGVCTQDVCFVDAIHLEEQRAVISDACRGCGRCVEVCPQQAIELSIRDGRFVERTIERLSPLVDVS